MIPKKIFTTFRQGSKTYFYSSLFFPDHIREDVFSLYAFVRKADDFVDAIPQQKKGWFAFKKNYYAALQGKKTDDIIIQHFISLQQRKRFKQEWVDAFLAAMEQDLNKKTYRTLNELESYMYGSAAVIGFMMSRIMDLPEKAFASAASLGRAMQYANFIRDIQEDNDLGRLYLPKEALKKFQLSSLIRNTAEQHASAFRNFIRAQIKQYEQYQAQAEKGFSFIPVRYRIPIRTASSLYSWTLKQIEKDPLLVYRKKVKPTVFRILRTLCFTALAILRDCLLQKTRISRARMFVQGEGLD